jgi:hypothetical protein
VKKRNELKKIALGALALFALAGCSARSVEPAPEPPRSIPDGAWLVYSYVAIPPSSPEAAEHLRSLDLCTDEQGERRLAMESALYNP